MQRFFLSFNTAGRQQFSTQNGQASGLIAGAPVITHHASLRSSFTMDTYVTVPVEQLPVTSILSAKMIGSWVVPDADDALRGDKITLICFSLSD
jgi:energy-converting hydrogenase Eha subunit A